MTIDISTDLSLPKNAVTQKLAFIGISGSGKTYAAGKFAEELLSAGAQVVIVDTVGNWYGLRLSASGKRASEFEIPILGGARGDVPLESLHGRLAAETVAESRASMILDVSDFTKGELHVFARDFAIELLRLKKRRPSPVMIIWEECQDIVPQRVTADQARTVGAVERLIKKGRNYGVGTVLISQRPAAVNKDVLSQVETLFAFRLIGKHDRKQIEDWIVEKELDIASLIDELPAMETGSCYVWSPQWLKVFKTIHVKKKRTFNASATPDFDDATETAPLAPVDLEKFKATMGAAIEQARASDPEMLKAKIRELEKQVKEHNLKIGEAVHRATEAAVRESKVKIVEKPILKEKDLARIEKLVATLERAGAAVTVMGGHFVEALQQVRQTPLPIDVKIDTGRISGRTSSRSVLLSPESRASLDRGIADIKAGRYGRNSLGELIAGDPNLVNQGLSSPEQRILDALAWFESVGITQPENTAVAFMAGYSAGGGAYNNPRGRLHRRELVEYVGGRALRLTHAGRKLARQPDRPATTAMLHESVLGKLPGPERRILECLLKAYPGAMSNDDLATAAGYAPGGGAYNNPRGRLRTLGLIEYVGGGAVRAREILFL